MSRSIVGDESHKIIEEALEPLGFTQVEARLYAALLMRPDQTGYRLSKLVGKGQPSVYAALATLEGKSAVVSTDGAARRYRAVPVTELLGRLRRHQDGQLARAAELLARLEAGNRSDSVAQLRDPEQILVKAEAMIGQATETIVFELSSRSVDALRPAFSKATARKVRAAGLVLRPEDAIEGTRSIVSPVGVRVATVWPADVLILIVDGRQALVAGLGEAGASQALWTDSLFLSVFLHNAVSSDILLHESISPDWPGPNLTLFQGHPPGFREFMSTGIQNDITTRSTPALG